VIIFMSGSCQGRKSKLNVTGVGNVPFWLKVKVGLRKVVLAACKKSTPELETVKK